MNPYPFVQFFQQKKFYGRTVRQIIKLTKSIHVKEKNCILNHIRNQCYHSIRTNSNEIFHTSLRGGDYTGYEFERTFILTSSCEIFPLNSYEQSGYIGCERGSGSVYNFYLSKMDRLSELEYLSDSPVIKFIFLENLNKRIWVHKYLASRNENEEFERS